MYSVVRALHINCRLLLLLSTSAVPDGIKALHCIACRLAYCLAVPIGWAGQYFRVGNWQAGDRNFW
jgi:hypothetical protein